MKPSLRRESQLVIRRKVPHLMLSFNERDLVDYCAANLAVDSQPIRR